MRALAAGVEGPAALAAERRRRRSSRGPGRARRSACSGRPRPCSDRCRGHAAPRRRRAAAAVRTDAGPRIRSRSPGSRGAGISDRRSRRHRLEIVLDNESSMGQESERALELWREGTARLLAGELEEAIGLFTRSLETQPTAEAYTFRGWAYSFAGRLDGRHRRVPQGDRHRSRRSAIPTTTSAATSMEQGRVDEAIPWFEKAKTAPRYEPRHFPYLNLGPAARRARPDGARRSSSSRGRCARTRATHRALRAGDAAPQGQLDSRLVGIRT